MEQEKDINVYIHGVPGRAKEVRAILKQHGAIEISVTDGTLEKSTVLFVISPSSRKVYFVSDCEYMDVVKVGRREIFLPEPEIVQEVREEPEYALKPFDKVLVRDEKNRRWSIGVFEGFFDEEYHCLLCRYKYCIPYAGNEHLLGTINSPD